MSKKIQAAISEVDRWHCGFGERTDLKSEYLRVKTLEMTAEVIKGNEREERGKRRTRN